jgi:hypothetical protein
MIRRGEQLRGAISSKGISAFVFVPEVDEDAPEVFIILFQAMVQAADVGLVQKPQHPFFELSTTLPRNNLDQGYLTVNRLLDDLFELGVYLIAFIIYVVKIERKFCHGEDSWSIPQPDALSRIVERNHIMHRITHHGDQFWW